jgi:predicted PurR-regulated permease PerM
MSSNPKKTGISHEPANSNGTRYFMLVFLVSIFFFGRILWPFWSILVLAFILSSLFRPIYGLLCRKLPESLSSVLTCMLIIAIVIVPLVFFIFAISDEALSLYSWGRDSRVGLRLQLWLQESPIILQLQDQLRQVGFSFNPTQVTDTFSYLVKRGGLLLYNQASGWAANVMQFLLLFFIMIVIIFFLLIDQPDSSPTRCGSPLSPKTRTAC